MWSAVDEGDVTHLRTLLHRHRLAPVFQDRAGRTPLYRAVVEKVCMRVLYLWRLVLHILDCAPSPL